MRVWLNRILWISATFLLVWLVAIFYWQSTSRMPAQSELLVYLGLVPLLLVGAGWGVYKAATHQTQAPADAALDGKNAAEDQASESARKVSEKERDWFVNIVATSLQSAAGNSASDVLAKLKDASLQAELDAELKNDDGFPVFSARIADMDVVDTQDAFAEWTKTAGNAELQWSEAQLRTLHLASLSIEELGLVVGTHPEVLLYLQQKEQGRVSKDDAVPNLRLVLLWPKRWGKEHQAAASSWVKTLLLEHGWPERRILLPDDALGDAGLVEVIDHLSLSAGRTQVATVSLFLACDSAIDQNEVDVLASQGKLFSGKNSSGHKPGEVSAGLLIADEKQSRLFGNGPLSTLHRASWGARGKSADEHGKISADLLGTLVTHALETSKIPDGQVKFVCSDNDHRASREAELAQMLSAKLPELDCIKDAVKAGQACGSTNRALTAAALCIAHQQVIDEQAPVVCVSLNDPFLRAAVVLTAADLEGGNALSASPGLLA